MIYDKIKFVFFIFILPLIIYGQTGSLKGTIHIDEKSGVLKGVIVKLENTEYSAVSDNEGNFYIKNIKPGKEVLFSCYTGCKGRSCQSYCVRYRDASRGRK